MFKLLNDDYKNVDLNIDNSIIVIDPPFNINYHYLTYKDNKKEKEYYVELADIIRNRPAVVIHYPESLHKLSVELGYAPEKVVSWVYNSNTAKQHRDIAFYKIKPDFTKVKQPYKNLNDKRIKERIKNGIEGGRLYDWWNINQIKNVQKKEFTHPCIMPLEIMKNIIGILPEDKIIIDCFMGTNTTGIACKLLNRNYIGIEIDKTYYDEAVKRTNNLSDYNSKIKCDNDKKLKINKIENYQLSIFDL